MAKPIRNLHIICDLMLLTKLNIKNIIEQLYLKIIRTALNEKVNNLNNLMVCH